MAKKKQTTLKKPVLARDAMGFAEKRPAKRVRGTARKADEPAGALTSRFPPSGDTRLTVNMRDELHMRLKMAAVKQRTTVGQIIEDLVEQHVKED